MVVLLVGGGSVLMNAMIDKLNKNGHRVYLLTGQKERRFSYRHVFEKYNFPYDSGSIKEILESVKPDVTVFTGAYDTNFSWETPRQDGVRYMTALMNILSAYSVLKKGRFLYFSSQEVFNGAYPFGIEEDEPTVPKGFRAMALTQGEETCANFRKTQGTETVILRFDHLYWVPEKGQTEDNPCFRLCLEGLKTGKISANSRRTFSMIYLNDAVEQIYELICAEAPKHSLYHISSMKEVGEPEIARLVQEELGSGVEVVDSTVGMEQCLYLSGSRFTQEFNGKIFNPYDTAVKAVVRFMKRHSASFLTEEDVGGGLAVKTKNNTRRIFKALFPFLENLVCFFPFFLLNSQAAGSNYL